MTRRDAFWLAMLAIAVVLLLIDGRWGWAIVMAAIGGTDLACSAIDRRAKARRDAAWEALAKRQGRGE